MKRIRKVTKSKATRKRKRLIVVGTEGKNQTETQYLHCLEKTQKGVHFIFAPGNETDPVQIVKHTLKRAKQEELSYRDGDMAVSIFDLDLDRSKIAKLEEAKKLALDGNVRIVSSNPCFELWYLEHFGFTTKAFHNSADLIRELKKHLPEYQKSSCDFDKLFPLMQQAIDNCRRLDEYHQKNGAKKVFEFNNPRTDVYKIIEILLDKKV